MAQTKSTAGAGSHELGVVRKIEPFDWELLKDSDEEFRVWCEKHARSALDALDFLDALKASRDQWESPHPEDEALLRDVFFYPDNTHRVFPITVPMITEVRKIMATEGARKKSKLTLIGDAAKAVAQRGILLQELERQSWNLTRTAEALGMSAPSSVIIAIKELGLDTEYGAAKEKGLVSKGRRPKNE